MLRLEIENLLVYEDEPGAALRFTVTGAHETYFCVNGIFPEWVCPSRVPETFSV